MKFQSILFSITIILTTFAYTTLSNLVKHDLSTTSISKRHTILSKLVKRDFSTTIFTPPSWYEVPRTLYARTLLLTVNDKRGTILATWENYSGGKTFFPIFRSIDHGKTWKWFSNVTDEVNGWGLRYQPFLYELKEDFGCYKAGSILLAGNSIPANLSETRIDLYISTDKGFTWKFLSHIAHGGRADDPANGKTPVWEPFLLVYKGKLHCYYSDQRDPKYGQKLVHQSSSNLKTWSKIVNDVTDPEYAERPGMASIAKMGNGKYIYSFEYCGKRNCNVYYKISKDPTRWNHINATQLITQDGTAPFSSPYTIWTPVGEECDGKGKKTKNGTVVTNSYSDGALYVNKHNGEPNAWYKISTPSPAQYTRSLAVGFNPKDIVIVGGGDLKDVGPLKGRNNSVTFYSRDVNGCDYCS